MMLPLDGVRFTTPEILVREISSNRSGQADVGKKTLVEFFGYQGQAKNILMQVVSTANQIGDTRQVPLFVNQSRNYRLELHATVGLAYQTAADDSRMILVAAKLDERAFRYTIMPVTAQGYAQVVALFGAVPPPSGNNRRRMREVRVSRHDLQLAWPGVPSHLLSLDALMPEATTLEPISDMRT